MSMELTLIGDLLVVIDEAPGAPDADAVTIRRMLGALEAGTITAAEFEDWVCLRNAVAESGQGLGGTWGSPSP